LIKYYLENWARLNDKSIALRWLISFAIIRNKTLSDIVDGDNDVYGGEQETRLPFVTAEDLLNKAKEKIESESTAADNID